MEKKIYLKAKSKQSEQSFIKNTLKNPKKTKIINKIFL